MTATIELSNDLLAIEFITTYRVLNESLWRPYQVTLNGKRIEDYIFWMNNRLWSELIEFLSKQPETVLEQIASHPDIRERQAQSCLRRLKRGEIRLIHRAAAAMTVELCRQSPKPTPYGSTGRITPNEHATVHAIATRLLGRLSPEEKQGMLAWTYTEAFRNAMSRHIDPVVAQMTAQHYLLIQELAHGTDPATAILKEMRSILVRQELARE